MTAIITWISTNLPLVSEILAAIVVLDHTLSQLSFVKANSTAEAIFNGVMSVVGWVQKLLPQTPSA